MELLGIDPGGTTGWAQAKLLEDKTLKPYNYGDCKDTSCLELKPMIEIADLVIVEGFLVDPSYARRGAFDYDDMKAPQVIGSLKTLCALLEKEMKVQPASVKPVGYGFLGREYKKGKKNQHKWDALAHVYYYAVKFLGAPPNI